MFAVGRVSICLLQYVVSAFRHKTRSSSPSRTVPFSAGFLGSGLLEWVCLEMGYELPDLAFSLAPGKMALRFPVVRVQDHKPCQGGAATVFARGRG